MNANALVTDTVALLDVEGEILALRGLRTSRPRRARLADLERKAETLRAFIAADKAVLAALIG